MDLVREKASLRRKAKELLKQIGADEKLQKDLDLSKNFLSYLHQHLDFNDSSIHIGVFDPIQKEPRWFESFECDDYKINFCYPGNLEDGKMDFVLLEKFQTGFGIDLKGEAIKELDTLFIPGLAFNEQGQRLGRGGGFYDRFLESFTGLKVGLCFEEQIFKNIPSQEHDLKVDYLITQNRILRCK